MINFLLLYSDCKEILSNIKENTNEIISFLNKSIQKNKLYTKFFSWFFESKISNPNYFATQLYIFDIKLHSFSNKIKYFVLPIWATRIILLTFVYK